MNDIDIPRVLNDLIQISKNAGDIILKYYNSANHDIEYKDDESPLTKADIESDNYIGKKLIDLYDIPIISEENHPKYSIRKDYTEFFLVDPLDGTKEFIEGNSEFTVNIAYIRDKQPILGVIYAPVSETFYYAAKNYGSYIWEKNCEKMMPFKKLKGNALTATGSRKHNTIIDYEFMQINNIKTIIPAGSSLKFCRVASGLVHLYPRFQGSMEWDIAAGHIIAKEAGCNIFDLKTKGEPLYNKESLKNNYFIVTGKGISISSLKFPKKITGVSYAL